jgi:hypothetical protein
MMLFLEEIHLEGEDGEEFIDIALDVLDAIFLPRPNLGRDVIIYRDVCMRFYILGYLEVEAWIIHKDDAIGVPLSDIALTHLHIAKYRRKMDQYGDEAHIGQFLIVAYTSASNC